MTEERTIDVDGQSLRIRIRRGAGTPLLIFNGIGASFELLDPFVDALKDVEVIVFDVPGVGGVRRAQAALSLLGTGTTRRKDAGFPGLSGSGRCARRLVGWRGGPTIRLYLP